MRTKEELIKIMLDHLDEGLITGLCLLADWLYRHLHINLYEKGELENIIWCNDPRPKDYQDGRDEDQKQGYYFERGNIPDRRRYLEGLLNK